MKLSPYFKLILFITLGGLFLSGLFVWILGGWFQVDHGLGPEPLAQQIWFVRTHALFGLWFLFLFGMLFQSHVLRGLKAKRKLKSGYALLAPIVVLCLTIPGLYYITNEHLKSLTAAIHTYLGMTLVIPFLIHWLIRPTPRTIRAPLTRRRRQRPLIP